MIKSKDEKQGVEESMSIVGDLGGRAALGNMPPSRVRQLCIRSP